MLCSSNKLKPLRQLFNLIINQQKNPPLPKIMLMFWNQHPMPDMTLSYHPRDMLDSPRFRPTFSPHPSKKRRLKLKLKKMILRPPRLKKMIPRPLKLKKMIPRPPRLKKTIPRLMILRPKLLKSLISLPPMFKNWIVNMAIKPLLLLMPL